MTDKNGIQLQDTNGSQRPNSELDIYSKAIDEASGDADVVDANFGLGYYERSEYWQQVEAFRDGLFAIETFRERLADRAVEEAKRELAERGYDWDVDPDRNMYRNLTESGIDLSGTGRGQTLHLPGWSDLDDDQRDARDRRRYLDERGEQLWSQLDEEAQKDAVREFVGAAESWTPPHVRMLQMRHEASRSIDARLLDNLFGRVSRQEVAEESSGDSDSVLGRITRRNNNK